MLAVVAEVVTLDRLVDEQVLREAGQQIGMLAQQRLALGVGLIEDVLDLFVDRGGGLLGIALRGAEIAADEDAVARIVKRDGADEPIIVYADELKPDDDVLFDNRDVLFTLNEI